MDYEDISVEDYNTTFKDTPHLLLDVRTEEEYAEGRIPGSVNIPLDDLPDRIEDIRQAANGEPVVVMCRSGMRSLMAVQTLRYEGLEDLKLYNLDTGILGWARQNLPLESGD